MWYQLQIELCSPDETELLSEFLEETGALSITLTDKYDNPVLEPAPGTTPLWPDVILTALYSEEDLANQAQEMLKQLHPNLSTSLQILEDQDWERVCMDDFKPQLFGKNLWICPSWTSPPYPDAVNLILDPGLAFGTGSHATTGLCLQWLDSIAVKDKTIIDFGCGSGILALAALKLGAKQAFAVDIDPQALQATQSNATVNHLSEEQLIVGYPDILFNQKPQSDILIANILLAPLLQLPTSFHSLIKPDGILVVSGLLLEQTATLIEAYQDIFIHQETHELNDWALLVFTRC